MARAAENGEVDVIAAETGLAVLLEACRRAGAGGGAALPPAQPPAPLLGGPAGGAGGRGAGRGGGGGGRGGGGLQRPGGVGRSSRMKMVVRGKVAPDAPAAFPRAREEPADADLAELTDGELLGVIRSMPQ